MLYRLLRRPSWMILITSVLLEACVSTPGRGTPGHYAWDSSLSAACRQNPANCAAMTGRETLSNPVHTVATAGATVYAAQRTLDSSARKKIEAALVECADGARSTVLLNNSWRFKGRTPTNEECNSLVLDKEGVSVKLAILLGQEMHEEALWCADHRLGDLRPGGYSLEPRYRHERGRTTHISPEQEAELLSQRRFTELEGTLKPDVVIHLGDLLRVLAIYDFKFRCMNDDKAPEWSEYPEGHPHEGYNQADMYKQALGVDPVRVVPRLGIVR